MFTLILLGFLAISTFRNFVMSWAIISNSTNLHKLMVESVTRAKIVFFDSNPVGRIMTKFSKDILVMD
jgi:ABC-type multidrug transport system fused ATPase/permease subunit